MSNGLYTALSGPGGAAKVLAGAESKAAISPTFSVSEGKNIVGDLLHGDRSGEGLPGSEGIPIQGRPTSQQLENLTAKHNVEFGVTYKLGPGKNGGGGQYYLHSGSRTRMPLPLERDRILVSHTHPRGTANASPADLDYLDGLRALGSKQRTSTIVPVGGRPFSIQGEKLMLPSSDNDVSELSYLWDGSDKDWVLFQLNSFDNAENARFVIQNERTKIALIIEDDDEYKEVVMRMRNAGARIVTP